MTQTVYPGSFDPITHGHLDIIRRGVTVFGSLRVAVSHNTKKKSLFSVSERKQLIRESVGDDPRVEVDAFEGLLVDYCGRVGATVVLRGLRAVADFEYEYQMANMNRQLSPGIETCFMVAGAGHFYVSSSLVREVAMLGGSIEDLVPAPVARALQNKYYPDKKR